jgi:hypothetical protein
MVKYYEKKMEEDDSKFFNGTNLKSFRNSAKTPK